MAEALPGCSSEPLVCGSPAKWLASSMVSSHSVEHKAAGEAQSRVVAGLCKELGAGMCSGQ